MNDLTVNDLSALIRLIDVGQEKEYSPRLSYIRVILADKAVEVNGGVDS